MRLEERLRRGQDEDVHPLQAQPWHASCSGATGRLRGPRSVENSLSERQKPKSCRQGHGASTRFFRGEGECRHRDHRWRHSRSGHPGFASTSGLSPHGRTADQESKTCDLTRRCSWAHMRQRRLADCGCFQSRLGRCENRWGVRIGTSGDGSHQRLSAKEDHQGDAKQEPQHHWPIGQDGYQVVPMMHDRHLVR